MNLRELLFLPINASAHGHEIDFVNYLFHIFMVVLLIGWGLFYFLCLFKFNKRANPKASYTGVTSHTSTWLEIAVVVFEAVILLAFAIPFWSKQVNAFPKRPDAMQVRVIAEQYAWNVHYSGADGVFGKTNLEYFDKQSNPLGIDPNDPAGKDDIHMINQLHLPKGKPAIIHLTSRDVVHSFSLPHMRVKQDVIPGMSIPTWFTPTKSGQFEIACAQLCGLGHYRMKGYLTVEDQETFDQWLANQTTAGGDGDEEFDDFWN